MDAEFRRQVLHFFDLCRRLDYRAADPDVFKTLQQELSQLPPHHAAVRLGVPQMVQSFADTSARMTVQQRKQLLVIVGTLWFHTFSFVLKDLLCRRAC